MHMMPHACQDGDLAAILMRQWARWSGRSPYRLSSILIRGSGPSTPRSQFLMINFSHLLKK